jgi:nucleotide-binding universal stress UspA family protein
MSLPRVPNGPVQLAFDGSEKAKAAIRRVGRQLCDGRHEIVLTLESAERRDADIVALGAHGRTGIIRLLLASIATATAGHTEPPVLIVHGG